MSMYVQSWLILSCVGTDFGTGRRVLRDFSKHDSETQPTGRSGLHWPAA